MCIQWWGCYQQAMKYSLKLKKYIMKAFWVLLCKWDVPHFEPVPDGQLVKRKDICGQVKVEWYNSQEKETPSQGITSCESLFYLSIFFLSSPPESYCCTKLTPSQWEVLTTSPLLDVKIQKMEPGPPKLEIPIKWSERIPNICHFFTLAKFLENKIYTESYTVNCQFTQ